MADFPLARLYNADQTERNATAENRTSPGNSSLCPLQIPKIIHLSFSSEMVYSNYRDYLKQCLALNPDWRVYLWRDSDSERFIKDSYPSFAAKFLSYNGDLQKSDAVRYAVLHRFGGVYLDMDIECVRPLFPSLQRLAAFVDRERWEQSALLFDRTLSLMNSAMGSVPGHPLFLHVLNGLAAFSSQYPVESTGPGALTKLYATWLTSKEARASSEVTILKPEVFSGVVDLDNPAIKNKCSSAWAEFRNPGPDALRKLEVELASLGMGPLAESPPLKSGRERNWIACASLTLTDWRPGARGHRGNGTLGVHRFLHLGYRFAASKRGAKFDLLKEFPGRVRLPDPAAGFVQAPPC